MHSLVACVLFVAVNAMSVKGATAMDMLSQDPHVLLNWCLKSDHTKTKPGREPTLTGECQAWANHACCHENTSRSAMEEINHYNFDMNHCFRQTNKKLSKECRRYFVRDTCFVDCEPAIGPWVIKTNRRFSSERIKNVPLCASECDAWYEACKDDYTCTHNLAKGLHWKGGVSRCKDGNDCRTFGEIHGNASAFCETVWDNSWKYTPDDQPCLKLFFDGRNNPNAKAAAAFLKRQYGITISSSLSTVLSGWLLLLTVTLVIL